MYEQANTMLLRFESFGGFLNLFVIKFLLCASVHANANANANASLELALIWIRCSSFVHQLYLTF